MSLNPKFYVKAEEEIKRRREISEQKLSLRKKEVETVIPQYKAIQRELAKTGARLSEIILSGGERAETREKLERLQRENLSAQDTVKTLLIQHKYDAEYLSEVHTCAKCRDTGVYQNRRCTCFREIVKRLTAEELNAASPMKLCGFDTFDLELYPEIIDIDSGVTMRSKMRRNFNYCKSFAENFHLPCSGILIEGGTGIGKTHISLAIAKVVIEKNYSVIYGSAPDLLRKIEREHFSRGRDEDTNTVELLQSADLLILDDLGAEFESQFYSAAFYNLLNSRINTGLPTIISTNLTRKQIESRYGGRIISRILTMECLEFCGNDIRAIKKFK
jgi:DNA replication protein DnaC